MTRHPLVVPDLDLPEIQMRLAAWLVHPGGLIVEGDSLAQVLAGPALIDLESPATGILTEQLATAHDELITGQTIGIIVSRE